MVFGKRAGSNGSLGGLQGGDDTYQKQPPHIRRLIDAMQAIFDDTSNMAQAIRQGRPLPSSNTTEPHLSPIRCSASEKLFEHTGEKGERLYTTYYFTKDFKSMNLSGQYFLHIMYSRIYIANLTINRSNAAPMSDVDMKIIKGALDEILVKSSYYISFFRGYTRSTSFFTNRFDKVSADAAMRDHIDDWTNKMNEAIRVMFQPERLLELVPDRQPCFVVGASGPYHEGQKVINGVHFMREHAEPLLADAAAAQAKTLGAMR